MVAPDAITCMVIGFWIGFLLFLIYEKIHERR